MINLISFSCPEAVYGSWRTANLRQSSQQDPRQASQMATKRDQTNLRILLGKTQNIYQFGEINLLSNQKSLKLHTLNLSAHLPTQLTPRWPSITPSRAYTRLKAPREVCRCKIGRIFRILTRLPPSSTTVLHSTLKIAVTTSKIMVRMMRACRNHTQLTGAARMNQMPKSGTVSVLLRKMCPTTVQFRTKMTHSSPEATKEDKIR